MRRPAHDFAEQNTARSAEAERDQAQRHDEQRVLVEEGLCICGTADRHTEENRNDVHQLVARRLVDAVHNTGLFHQIAQHQHADKRHGCGKDQTNDDGADNGEHDLFQFGNRTKLFHYDHTFFLCGKRAHDRRLDDGHQRHIAVRGHSDSAKQFRRQLAGNENGCRAVRTADDADGAGLRAGKTKQLRSDVSSENAKLCGSAQQQALRVGDQRAEIRHRTDTKEDQRRINAQLDANIYGNWRKVLEYFDTARLVGLTATPIPETMAFFNNNCIVNYTLEKSIVDGVNVDCRVYRIKTQVTETGGAILEGEKFKEETRYTGEVKIVSSKETKIYTNKELNRSIINPAQIKLVLSTYRDVVYTELFNDPQREPNMDFLPKTLIFALNEAHATNIVQIAKEVFGRTDDRFVQKITYSAGDSNELIRQFRNDKDFRIAVTCTLVATGTDVKPLEVVMFMRDVESLPLYIQMKGRGVRTIGDEQLRNVTPNAFSKDCFYLVDAVGVTEHAQTVAPIDDAPTTKTITLKELLERISHGYIPDEYLKRLAATLARIYNKADDPQRKEFVRLSHDDMKELSARIYDALEKGILPPFVSTDEPNNERKGLVAPLANHADARKYLLILAAGFVNTLMPGEDTLISKGFSIEEAKNTTEAFEDFCKKYYDEIEALRIIYNNEGEPITYSMLKDLENRLKMANNHFTSKQLWNSYAIVNPKVVRRSITKEESDALTNIIQLVRFAFHQIERLDSVVTTSKQFFNLWLGQNQREITDKQREVISRIVDYIASNGACTIRDIREDDATHAAQMIRAFDNMQKADEALHSLYTFVVLRKAA